MNPELPCGFICKWDTFFGSVRGPSRQRRVAFRQPHFGSDFRPAIQIRSALHPKQNLLRFARNRANASRSSGILLTNIIHNRVWIAFQFDSHPRGIGKALGDAVPSKSSLGFRTPVDDGGDASYRLLSKSTRVRS
jgi:hypothetical protein